MLDRTALDLIQSIQKGGIQMRDVFLELSRRFRTKDFGNQYQKRLIQSWREGNMGPKTLNSKIDAITEVNNSLDNFIKSVLDENTVRPFNSPARKIQTAADWVDAIETLYGFINYYEQAVFTKGISQKELEDLEMFCNQSNTRLSLCEPPCDVVGKGFFNPVKTCSVKGKKVEIPKGRAKELITIKGIAYRQ